MILSTFLVVCVSLSAIAQNVVKGVVVDSNTENPLKGVSVKILNTTKKQETGADGIFTLSQVPNGSYLLEITFVGYETQNFPLELNGKTVDLGTILLYKNIAEDQDLQLITITDDELNDDASAADNIAGLLQATQDIFLRTAAFEFSSSFFRVK